MDNIWIDLNQLYQLLRRMRKDDICTVHLSIDGPDEFDGATLPAVLSVSGIKSSDPDCEISYTDDQELEAVPVKTPSTGHPASLDLFE